MIANEGHIPAFLAMGDRIRLQAVCGRNPETTERTAKRYGIPFVFADAEQMLSVIRPDIVAVCTPNQTHAVYSEMALEYGCHVICEKPVALDSRQVRGLYELAGQKNRYLVACQTQRFQPKWFQARKMVREGTLGEIISARFDRIRSRGIPTWGGFHRKADSGGGAMADIGVHMLDGLLWMLGNPKVISVMGFTSDRIAKTTKDLCCDPTASGARSGVASGHAYDADAFDVEEYASGILRLETGVPVSFQAAWAANSPEKMSLEILGTRAGITIPEMCVHNGTSCCVQQPEKFPCLKEEWQNIPFAGHRYLLSHVLNVLDGVGELMITPEETINVCTALELFYRSAAEKREVFLSEL